MTDFFTHIYGLLLEGDGTVLIILYSGILCFWWYLLILTLAVIRGCFCDVWPAQEAYHRIQE
ncbi:hypothetical protein FHI53_19920 [Salmonella enterica]|nr:hypothetical protein [Salmonella enterica]